MKPEIIVKTSIPWNNEPAPIGSLSAIFLGKIFLGTKKNFLRRKKNLVGKNEIFFEKK